MEGQQQANAVKIEVWREATGQSPLALELPGIVAVVTDDRPVGVTCPVWSRCELSAIADRVLELAR